MLVAVTDLDPGGFSFLAVVVPVVGSIEVETLVVAACGLILLSHCY